MKSTVIFVVLIAFFSLSSHHNASAKSSVWQISKGKHEVYLGGTVHLLNENDHPLPVQFRNAYKRSQIVVLETDLEAASTPAFQAKMMAALSSQDGSTLSSVLSPKTYALLSEFAKERSLPLDNFASFTPAGLSLMLTIMEYQRIGLKPEYGVDVTFNKMATRDKKPVASLETPDTQLAFIAGMNRANPDDIITHTIRDLNKIESLFGNLKNAWRKGDLKTLEKEGITELKKEFPKIYNQLITTRNLNWIDQIHDLIETPDTEFILVGALHLAGPEGLIEKLRKSGFRITQLQ